ncbi:MAG: cell division protein FtsA [Nitrospiraceae bacterium]|nr:MAG: cell division protein FtsA [Nitrospiraceae bacterium]
MQFGFIREVALKQEKLVVGLDVGSTRVRAVVGEINSSYNGNGDAPGSIKILGVGTSSSRGIRKGVVTNIESTAASIREAVQEAEKLTGIQINAVHLGITGSHINCISSHGVIAVKEKEIGQKEIDSVIDSARAVAIPFDREILHVIPEGFTVNGQEGITDPRGMGGVRLETNVQIVSGDATSIQNMLRSCEKAGLEVIESVYQPLASADAILTEDEKELGVAMIDIGGGTTEVSCFREGSFCHSAVIAIGGNNFTNDVAIGLRISTREAEYIKKKYGCTLLTLTKDDDEVEIGYDEGSTSRKIPRRYLVEILQPRAEELFSLIKEEMAGKGLQRSLNAGVVLTGGGVLMEGMDVMVENILELPVRTGYPVNYGVDAGINGNPCYSTGVGLVLYGAEEFLPDLSHDNGHIFNGTMAKIKDWMSGKFK